MLEISGKYIWEVNFTLYSDGEFKINFSYEKPDDYEENNFMTGDEFNASLKNLFGTG